MEGEWVQVGRDLRIIFGKDLYGSSGCTWNNGYAEKWKGKF